VQGQEASAQWTVKQDLKMEVCIVQAQPGKWKHHAVQWGNMQALPSNTWVNSCKESISKKDMHE